MAIERSNRPVADARITATARRLLDASTLCAIATVTPAGSAHLNTAYFAWSRDFDIVWLSERRARHSRNLHANKSVAIVVYDSAQTWGKPDRGIQLFGSAREVQGKNANQARPSTRSAFPTSPRPISAPTACTSSGRAASSSSTSAHLGPARS